MTDLVALVSSGSGTIEHVMKVIEGENWERIFLITTKEFKDKIAKNENCQIITIDSQKVLPELIEDIRSSLKGKLEIMETAVNIISGTGKEHMALLSALLKLGCGIRLVALTKEGVREV